MKVILLKDIPRVGNKNDIKDFKDGYAQNVLIARGLAILATKVELNKLEEKKKQINKEKQKEEELFFNLVSDLDKKNIELSAKANEKGNLFKSINSNDISESIKKSHNIFIDPKFIFVEIIKNLGRHKFLIKKGNFVKESQVFIKKN